MLYCVDGVGQMMSATWFSPNRTFLIKAGSKERLVVQISVAFSKRFSGNNLVLKLCRQFFWPRDFGSTIISSLEAFILYVGSFQIMPNHFKLPTPIKVWKHLSNDHQKL